MSSDSESESESKTLSSNPSYKVAPRALAPIIQQPAPPLHYAQVSLPIEVSYPLIPSKLALKSDSSLSVDPNLTLTCFLTPCETLITSLQTLDFELSYE